MAHRVMAAAVVVVSLMPVPARGQTPDLQGHWQHDAVLAGHSVEDGRNPLNDIITGEYLTGRVSRSGERNPIVIVEPADGRIPYQSTAAVKRDEFLANLDTPTKLEHIDPHARSLLDGVPRANYDRLLPWTPAQPDVTQPIGQSRGCAREHPQNIWPMEKCQRGLAMPGGLGTG